MIVILVFGFAEVSHSRSLVSLQPSLLSPNANPAAQASGTVFSRVAKLVSEHQGDNLEITLELELYINDPDPILQTAYIEMVKEIEEEFGIKFPQGDAKKWKTVGDIVKAVQKALKARS